MITGVLALGVWILLFTGVITWLGVFLGGLVWADHAWANYQRRKEDRHYQYRRGFLAGFNFAVGKGGLPPEIIDWPSAIKEVTQDHDPNCS